MSNMKKLPILLLALLLVSSLILSACTDDTETTTSQTSTTAQSTTTTTTTTSSVATTSQSTPTVSPIQNPAMANLNDPIPPEGTPEYGGILRRLESMFPRTLGYPPDFGTGEGGISAYCLERLNQWDEHGNLIGVLAESWEGDPEAMTVTWHLRKGIKFTDGTDFNASVLKWNFERQIPSGRLTDGKKITSLNVLDDYTLELQLSDYNIMMFQNYGAIQIASQAAFENAGDTEEERIAWARMNPVGTGPFTLVDFQRDTLIKWERNPNYWRPGMPYYDGIYEYYISDSMTASAKMRAGEADLWALPSTQDAKALENIGFKVNWGVGLGMILGMNSSDPDSPYAIQKVREAVEYAINRPTLANMLGQGTYEPLTQLAGKNFPGYNAGYDPRAYNPEKAKQLLAEAGFSSGFKTKITTSQDFVDSATIIQGYLKAVGIDAAVDMADSGRYLTEAFGTGWSDLILTMYGVNPDSTDLFVHFGTNPMTFRSGTIAKSQQFLDMCEDAIHTYDATELIAKEKAIVKQASEDAMVVPLYITTGAFVMAPYVHSSVGFVSLIQWNTYHEWMDQD